MARRNGPNIANGVIALFVLGSGITFCVLVSTLFKKAVDLINDDTSDSFGGNFLNSSLPVWTLGLAYIVPGLLGVISSFVQGKGMFITHMVFCIITLLVMGIFFIISIFVLGALAVYSPGSCFTDGDICECGGVLTPTTINYTCEDLNNMYIMGISIMVICVVAWVLTLTNTILAGILSCRQEPLHQGVVHVTSVPGTVHPVGYVPQTHDSAKLAHNMQY